MPSLRPINDKRLNSSFTAAKMILMGRERQSLILQRLYSICRCRSHFLCPHHASAPLFFSFALKNLQSFSSTPKFLFFKINFP